jgi:hypothetical protein
MASRTNKKFIRLRKVLKGNLFVLIVDPAGFRIYEIALSIHSMKFLLIEWDSY